MVRITKRVFTDLAIFMIGFGMVVGIAFPFLMVVLGMSHDIAYTWWFFTVCIIAGLFVGAVNIILAHSIVGSRLILMAQKMEQVESHLKEIGGKGGDEIDCTPEACHLPVDSEDAIGTSSRAFNSLVDTLGSSLQLEKRVRSYTSMLTSHLKISELCQNALGALLEMFEFSGGAIFVEEGGALNLRSSQGLSGESALGENPIVLKALQTLEVKVIDIPEELFVDAVLATFRPRAVVVQPVVYKGVGLGVILLASQHSVDEETAQRLDLFSASFALALHNAVTYAQVQQLAAIDPLTGIYNRRFGLSRLHEEYVRAVKQNGSIGLLMIDADYFKEINDTYGHTVGDRVLQSIATTARRQLRDGDIIARLGGDEFMAVLLGANKTDTLAIAESIRRSIEEKRMKWGDQEIKVTVSIGAVSLSENIDLDEEKLIEAADAALYQVKESGRNRAGI